MSILNGATRHKDDIYTPQGTVPNFDYAKSLLPKTFDDEIKHQNAKESLREAKDVYRSGQKEHGVDLAKNAISKKFVADFETIHASGFSIADAAVFAASNSKAFIENGFNFSAEKHENSDGEDVAQTIKTAKQLRDYTVRDVSDLEPDHKDELRSVIDAHSSALVDGQSNAARENTKAKVAKLVFETHNVDALEALRKGRLTDTAPSHSLKIVKKRSIDFLKELTLKTNLASEDMGEIEQGIKTRSNFLNQKVKQTISASSQVTP